MKKKRLQWGSGLALRHFDDRTRSLLCNNGSAPDGLRDNLGGYCGAGNTPEYNPASYCTDGGNNNSNWGKYSCSLGNNPSGDQDCVEGNVIDKDVIYPGACADGGMIIA